MHGEAAAALHAERSGVEWGGVVVCGAGGGSPERHGVMVVHTCQKPVGSLLACMLLRSVAHTEFGCALSSQRKGIGRHARGAHAAACGWMFIA